MSIKIFIISLQILSVFLFPTLFSSPKIEEDITIYKVEGRLNEFSKSQFITLFIKSPESIESKDISQIEILKGDVSYNPNIDCFETLTSSDINEVNCYLDLTKISFGKYKIKSFIYKTEQKSSDISFEIEEIADKKISEMHLTSFYEEIKEFQENQKFVLVFDTNIKVPSRLQRMKLVNGQNKKYSIEIRCSKDDHSIVSLNCIANFPLNIGKYQIIDFLFYNGVNDFEFINTKENIFIDIKADILELKRVYGEAHNEKINIMGLKFQDIVYIKYFSKFFLRNTQTSEDYEIYYKFENEITHSSADEKIIFDLSKIPLGEYYINFVYKCHGYINNVVRNIKQVEKIDISYDDEGIEN